ncbi:MAG: cob(I)yrinic acid a,c-diamide adenosyltransferase [Propionibacteriaceae bacterium]|jgi:cob(I)alamin adenosyltransferase|nr:cob(I)yrinic acid a,c-diamide adenosyltransferase [Propionibacteriaceae bacterium]
MVNLTRIYTRTGDKGTTRLANNCEVSKSDPRIEAYGTVDETNSLIGIIVALGELSPEVSTVLMRIQNDLFDCGADLSTPMDIDGPALRVESEWVDQLESWCDSFGADLPPLRSFLLPGGTPAAAYLNLARTVVRRGERAAWEAAKTHEVNPIAIQYLNRLSDLLFILGRYINLQANKDEVLWVPAQSRGAG